MHSMYSMLYTANLGLCDYVLFSQIRLHNNNGISFCKQYIMMYHDLDISRCVNPFSIVIVTYFYHDINNTLKYIAQL